MALDLTLKRTMRNKKKFHIQDLNFFALMREVWLSIVNVDKLVKLGKLIGGKKYIFKETNSFTIRWFRLTEIIRSDFLVEIQTDNLNKQIERSLKHCGFVASVSFWITFFGCKNSIFCCFNATKGFVLFQVFSYLRQVQRVYILHVFIDHQIKMFFFHDSLRFS